MYMAKLLTPHRAQALPMFSYYSPTTILFYVFKIPTPSPHFFPIFIVSLGVPIESEKMDRFLHSRYLNNNIVLPDMIGSCASSTDTFLVGKNGTKKTFQTSQFSITISCYLEAEIDYRHIILLYRVSQDYAQEVSS